MKPLHRRAISIFSVLWLPTLSFVLSACGPTHATVSLGEHFYTPPPAQESPYPLKVAILADAAVKSERLEYWANTTIIFHPGFINAVQTELATVFKEVRIVESPSQVKDEDLVATIESTMQQTNDGMGFGNAPEYSSRLKVRFKDVKTGTPITSYTGDAVFRPRYYYSSLFDYSREESSLRDIEDLLKRYLREMSAKLRNDHKLAMYLADRTSSSTRR